MSGSLGKRIAGKRYLHVSILHTLGLESQELVHRAQSLAGIAEDVLELPAVHPWLAPIVYAIPLQLLAYHIAVLRGCDVDQPRNLAKSVTVE